MRHARTALLLTLLGVVALSLLRVVHWLHASGRSAVDWPVLTYQVPACDLGSQLAAHLTAWAFAKVGRFQVEVAPAQMSINRTNAASKRSPIPLDWVVNMGPAQLGAARQFGCEFTPTNWDRQQFGVGPMLQANVPGRMELKLPLHAHTGDMPASTEVAATLRTAVKKQGARLVEMGVTFPVASLKGAHKDAMRAIVKDFEFAPIITELANRVMAGAAAAYKQADYTAMHIGKPMSPACSPDNSTIDTAALDKEVDTYKAALLHKGIHDIKYPVFVSASVPGVDDFVAARLIAKGFCPAVFTRSSFIERRYLNMFPEEALEAVDFLIHMHAQAFVGHGSSTFAYLVSQFRKVKRNVDRSVFVEAQRLHVLRATLKLT